VILPCFGAMRVAFPLMWQLMRNVYLVCYDVADDKRLRKTYKIMCGVGDPLQYSVFRCELSEVDLQKLKSTWAEDRVMLVNLGPTGARGDECIEFWGEPRVTPAVRAAVVV
jgi:CRISPR-associated protein Cas2